MEIDQSRIRVSPWRVDSHSGLHDRMRRLTLSGLWTGSDWMPIAMWIWMAPTTLASTCALRTTDSVL